MNTPTEPDPAEINMAVRRRMLIAMTKHQDPALAECAHEILRGRLSLASAVTGSAYAERFAASGGGMLARWEQSSPAERSAQAEAFRVHAVELLREPEPPPPEPPRPPTARRPRVLDEDEEPFGPFMR